MALTGPLSPMNREASGRPAGYSPRQRDAGRPPGRPVPDMQLRAELVVVFESGGVPFLQAELPGL